MQAVSIQVPRISIRDLAHTDRAAFIAYQTDPRYLRLYDFADDVERPGMLFDLFLDWQRETPRVNFQLGIFEPGSERLLGCGGLRKVDDDVAVLGLELAPSEWGRFGLALNAAAELIRYGFESFNLVTIIGDTASGNRRVAKLARWFGAEIVARRDGPAWMQARGWQEVDWAITGQTWQHAKQRLGKTL